MKILVATDSFKDALPALQVCEAIRRGILKEDRNIEVQLFPLADGGEGTAEILTWHSQGTWQKISVRDPLLRSVQAAYGLSKDRQTAFIEMAAASGLQLLKLTERNCLETSTYGTGELILDAIRQGVHKIILGIGGSATNDVGIGMAAALGYRFLDQKGVILEPVGKSLGVIAHIHDAEAIDKSDLEVQVLCDVDNPLFGAKGAAQTYARQKGADAAAIDLLDRGAEHFSGVLEQHFQKAIANIPGSGAAGGLGAGALTFLNAKLSSGIDFVLQQTAFENQLTAVDLIITGEGKIDEQTLHGKLIQGITRMAQKKAIPVIALCGVLATSPTQIQEIGLHRALSINKKITSLEQALATTAENLERTAAQVVRDFVSRR